MSEVVVEAPVITDDRVLGVVFGMLLAFALIGTYMYVKTGLRISEVPGVVGDVVGQTLAAVA